MFTFICAVGITLLIAALIALIIGSSILAVIVAFGDVIIGVCLLVFLVKHIFFGR